MRIAKATLTSRWIWATGLGVGVFAVLAWLDYRLKALSGVNISDLAGFSSWAQFQLALRAWRAEPSALQAGFTLGFSYLLMPLYAASFFYSGIIAAEAFAPSAGQLRRILMALVWVPVLGAIADALGNAAVFAMMAGGPTENLAMIAAGAGRIRMVALLVGLALFVGAAMAWFQGRRAAKQTR